METSSIVSGLTQGRAAGSSTKLSDDFNTFLTLLTTQLQHQDPLDPMDSSEFTGQLVQFTGVEQAIQTNQNLENLVALIAMQNMNQAVGYLGKAVTVNSDTAFMQDGSATWLYELDLTAESSTVQVKDDFGRIIRTMDGPTQAGMHGYTWDGLDDNGNPQPDGFYSLHVEAVSSTDSQIQATVFIRDIVKSIENIGGESFLDVAGLKVPITDVLVVTEPTTPENPLAS